MNGPRYVRTVAGLVVVSVIVGAAAVRVAAGESLPPWLVVLVSVLGLAAGTAAFGADAVRFGAGLFGDGP